MRNIDSSPPAHTLPDILRHYEHRTANLPIRTGRYGTIDHIKCPRYRLVWELNAYRRQRRAMIHCIAQWHIIARIKSPKSSSELIPNSTWNGEYCLSNRLRLSWISAEKNAYKWLTVKFPEFSSEIFRKRLFRNTGEGRFREFVG
jgi:hypothetical protein